MASRGVNKVILVGNIGRDPESRYLPSGGAVTNAALATSEVWKEKNTGQDQEKTEWHRLVFFNRLAEIVNEYVRKGSKLYIEGRLQTRSWEQDGITRYATEIVVSEMQMLDTRQGGNDNSGYQQQGSPQHQGTHQQSDYRGHTGSNQQNPTSQGGSQGQQRNTHPAQPAPSRPADFDNFDDDIPF